jgi:catechol-2,3-dioxygenase
LKFRVRENEQSLLPPGTIGGLVEIVLRVNDLDAMQAFYGETLGLPFWRRFGDDMVFFKLPETVGGRSQAIALFIDRWPSNAAAHSWAGLDSTTTTMHHFALAIALKDLRRTAAALEGAGVKTVERVFHWVGWRSLMLQDPEGNVIELVADDPSVLDPNAN